MSRQFHRHGISAIALAGALSAFLIAWYFYPWKARWGRTTFPGVAFSFTPDYATAAVRYANGTEIRLPPAYGSLAYRNFMRREESSLPTGGLLCEYIPPALRSLALGRCNSEADGDLAGAEALMRELRASVASVMGTNFCYASMTSRNIFEAQGVPKSILEKALQNIGLVQGNMIDAGRGALAFNGLDTYPETGLPPALVLVVDHSDYGTSSQVFWRDEEVLHGDAIGDGAFRDVLRAVVGPKLLENAATADPLYASAVFAARSAYDTINRLDFGEEPAFGCCWKSQFHNCWEYRQVVHVCQ
ncbi:unnamed protein product [Parascedosporium putredinis]|uniref:Uncharacterized protein n=1 Tax=Parascedosporium putredinis TaxID=1442378 RepID=A0A9P1H781_9PEZI|nr:unnamed protein product [Parascedosporium putredinis]CAI7999398.1 unnamed protein product [Parascedosporium putredinis]